MKAAEIWTKSSEELEDSLLKLRKEQFNMRFRQANGQLENTAQIRQVRRDIARIKTVLQAKKVEA